MKNRVYDIEKLTASGKFDTSIIMRFFYHVQDYYDALTDFVENYQRCLINYTPAFVVNSEEDRKNFLEECFKVRAVFMRLGATDLLGLLGVMEDSAISRSAKEFSDGQVNFAATLEIYISIVKDAEQKSRKSNPKNTTVAMAVGSRRPTVMVVDQPGTDLQLLTEILQVKYEVLSCLDGQTAIAALRARTPDLFILSSAIQGINGYELAFLINSILKFSQRPIWFISNPQVFDPVRACMPPEATVYLQKPINGSHLLKMIEEHFAHV